MGILEAYFSLKAFAQVNGATLQEVISYCERQAEDFCYLSGIPLEQMIDALAKQMEEEINHILNLSESSDLDS